MIIGYLMVGAVAGLVASVIALLLGASFWLALGLYSLVGSAIVMLLPAARILAGILVDPAEAPIATDNWSEPGNPRSRKLSGNQQRSGLETSMRILAVDDDPFTLELIPMISAKAGFAEVTAAASGEQALKLLVGSNT